MKHDATEGDAFTLAGRAGTVAGKCDDKTAPGVWACITHDELFAHNWAMQTHVETGTHAIVWVCSAHGPEVP